MTCRGHVWARKDYGDVYTVWETFWPSDGQPIESSDHLGSTTQPGWTISLARLGRCVPCSRGSVDKRVCEKKSQGGKGGPGRPAPDWRFFCAAADRRGKPQAAPRQAAHDVRYEVRTIPYRYRNIHRYPCPHVSPSRRAGSRETFSAESCGRAGVRA